LVREVGEEDHPGVEPRNQRLTNVYSTNFFGLYDWVNIGTTDGV
jgi:hypothetical protein